MEQQESSYWDAIEPIWDLVNFYDGEETYLASISTLDRPLVLLYAAHFAYSEICNGGFQQFYWNSTGAIGPETVEGYRLIGMPELAALMERASALLEYPYPRDSSLRQHVLFRVSGSGELDSKSTDSLKRLYEVSDKDDAPIDWNALNKDFYRLAETENGGFEAAANRYVAGYKAVASNNPSPHPPNGE
jgi:hypothetical protein